MDEPECPLCLEPLAIDDINFYPCVCRYQICRFCWHRIRTDEGGRCPHCRTVYSENPAEYNPPSAEQINQLKSRGKKKNQDKKQKIVESRKNLADVRVVQKNLVFVLGLSPRLADPEILKKPEYFGKYGKIHKVVLNHQTIYNGSLGPSVSAYVTYQREEDALRAMQAVNNAFIDGRILKASFGTTKYCSFYLRGLQCTKPDCMYLHELGDIEASFTKEDMQQGKHQDYELATLESQSITINKDYPSKKRGNKQGSASSGATTTTATATATATHNKTVHYKTSAESALPSTSNWGSRGDKSHRKVQKQLSVPHAVEPRLLHRTHSNPVRCHDDNEPAVSSLSCSPESTSSSFEGRGRGGGGGEGRERREAENEEQSHHSISLGTGSQCSDVTTDYDDDTEEGGAEGKERGVVNPPLLAEEDEGREERVGEKVEERAIMWRNEDEEDNGTIDVFKSLGIVTAPSCDFGSLGVNWSGDPPPPQSHSSGEPLVSSPPPLSSSPVLVSMPWEVPHESSTGALADLLNRRERISPPLATQGPIDERQRLASASYVNYGPTTNSHLDELQTKGTVPTSAAHSLQAKPKGDSLQLTLDDGFKSLFPPGSMQSLENAIQASSLDAPPPSSSSSKLFSLFQNSSSNQLPNKKEPLSWDFATGGHLASGDNNGEWPNIESGKLKGGDVIAPPPGFGNCKPSSKAAPISSYTLWGEGNSLVDNTGLASSLGQKQLTDKPPAAASQRPVPVGAIQHNLLEASLFSSPTASPLQQKKHQETGSQKIQQQIISSANPPPPASSSNRPPLILNPQQQQMVRAQQNVLKHQQQQRAMLLRQQQKQQYQKQQHAQLAAIQQHMLLYQQQVLAQQQQQGTGLTGVGGIGVGVGGGSGSQKRATAHPHINPSYKAGPAPAGSSKDFTSHSSAPPPPPPPPPHHHHHTPLYFGGWYPAYAAWGLPTATLAVGTGSVPGHNIGRLATGTSPGLQQSRSASGGLGREQQQQHQTLPSSSSTSQIDQKFQNVTLN